MSSQSRNASEGAPYYIAPASKPANESKTEESSPIETVFAIEKSPQFVDEDDPYNWINGPDGEKLNAAHKEIRVFSQGEVILEQGKHNEFLYRIKSGKCRVHKVLQPEGSNLVTLATLKAPDIFGEISFLHPDLLVSATVVSEEDTEIYVFDAKSLEKFFARERKLCEGLYKFLALRASQRMLQYHANTPLRSIPHLKKHVSV